VAEIYGQPAEHRVRLAAKVKEIFESTEGVVDVDWYREEPRMKEVMTVDKEKAALHGLSEADITRVIETSLKGLSVVLLHQPTEKEEVPILLQLPISQRARIDDLLNIKLRTSTPSVLVPLRELVTVHQAPVDQPIYRKNLKPVIYVTGDVAGIVESPVYAIFSMNRHLKALDGREFGSDQPKIPLYNINQPFSETEPAIKWDGEWHITLEVFRDLGLAFCVVMILIYMLMVGWFKDYLVPLVVMAAIPFSLMFGEIASLLISRMAVPVLYFMLRSHHHRPPQPHLEP
jgi:multidrug efflux pump subunit AcrB